MAAPLATSAGPPATPRPIRTSARILDTTAHAPDRSRQCRTRGRCAALGESPHGAGSQWQPQLWRVARAPAGREPVDHRRIQAGIGARIRHGQAFDEPALFTQRANMRRQPPAAASVADLHQVGMRQGPAGQQLPPHPFALSALKRPPHGRRPAFHGATLGTVPRQSEPFSQL